MKIPLLDLCTGLGDVDVYVCADVEEVHDDSERNPGQWGKFILRLGLVVPPNHAGMSQKVGQWGRMESKVPELIIKHPPGFSTESGAYTERTSGLLSPKSDTELEVLLRVLYLVPGICRCV